MERDGMDLNREVGEVKVSVRFLLSEVQELKKDMKTLLGFKERLAGKIVMLSIVAASVGMFLADLLKDYVSKTFFGG